MSSWIETRETRHFASEIKFLVDAAVANEIREWARLRLAADPHGSGDAADQYVTTSVYYDTDAFDVARRRGSYGRCKYRVRRYGQSDVVFLERKLRTSQFLSKRRSIAALDDLELLHDGGSDADWTGRWFQRRVRARELRPVCQVSYLRTARVAVSSTGPARLTIDDALHARVVEHVDFNGAVKTRVLEDAMVVEMKYRVAPPPVFKELARTFNLTPQPVSKYRLSARELGLIPALDPGVTPASSEASS
jgi:VTC domain